MNDLFAMLSYFTGRKQVLAFTSDLRDYRVSSTEGGWHLTFALGIWEDAAGPLSKSTEFGVQILRRLFSGICDRKKPHEL